MIGVIATLTVKPEMVEKFEKHAKALVETVHASEPDCTIYELFKSEDGVTYMFMEKYTDKAAHDKHGETTYFQAVQPILVECLAGAPDVKVYEAV